MIFSLHKSKNSFTESKSFKIKLWIAFIHASINLTILFTIQFFSCFRPKKRIKQYIILGSLAPHHHNNTNAFVRRGRDQLPSFPSRARALNDLCMRYVATITVSTDSFIVLLIAITTCSTHSYYYIFGDDQL